MSMSELTDDQLDGLFRKSAEEFDPPFDPAAWQDMKARLDANDRTKPGGASTWKNLLRWSLPILLLLFLTGGVWYAYRKANPTGQPTTISATNAPITGQLNTTAGKNNQPETSRLANSESRRHQPVGSSEVGSKNVEPSADRTGLAGNNAIEPEARAGVSGDSEGRIAAEVEANRATKSAVRSYRSITKQSKRPSSQRIIAVGERVERVTKGAKNPTRKPVAFKENRSVQRGRGTRRTEADFLATIYATTSTPLVTKRRLTNDKRANQSNTVSSINEVTQLDAVQPGNGQTESNNPSASSITVTELAGRPAKWPQPLSFTGRPVQFQPDRAEQITVTRPTVQRGLSVRLAVAPDLSGVGLKNFSRPGTNVGLLLEYRLAARWSVQTGLIQSTKVYKALPDEYGYLPDYLEKYKPNLAQVDGRCSMFDIPINIRYDVILKPRQDGQQPTRWFISSGITSYVMKQEDYTYSYYHYYSSNIPNASASTGSYRFSTLNLSVGYERALSKRLSWQVEPFIKAPLKGVGYFKIDLLSTGAFFSLRYKL